jgi:phosphoribosylpyrophosphate synthetase
MPKNMCNSSSSPPAIERLSRGLFQEVIITNTIPVKEQNYKNATITVEVAENASHGLHCSR